MSAESTAVERITDRRPAQWQAMAESRAALLRLLEALDASPTTLRRDECGDWRVMGKTGHVYAVAGGFQLCVALSPRAWGFAKKAMSFCRVTQDGDEDGALFLDRLPTAIEAEVIRDKLTIRKRREVGEEQLARLRKWASDNRAVQPPELASDDEAAPLGPATLRRTMRAAISAQAKVRHSVDAYKGD